MSQQIDRLVASRGPALVTYKSSYFLSKEDIVVDLSKETKDIPSSAYGPIDKINLGVKATTKFTPVGEFEHLTVLWPYPTTLPGTSIFGSQDWPLLIQPLDTNQKQVTFHAAGLSKMPDLKFTAEDTLMSELEFQMIGKNNTAVDNANRLFTYASNTLASVPFDPTKVYTQAYNMRWMSDGTFTLTFGANTTSALDWDSTDQEVEDALNALASIVSAGGVTVSGNVTDGWTVTFDDAGDRGAITGAVTDLPGGTEVRADVLQGGTVSLAEVVHIRLYPWNNFANREGAEVTFELDLSEDKSDAVGHYDTIFRGLKVMAKIMPQGVTDEAMALAAALQGSGSVRGRRLSQGAHHLDIFGTGVYFRLYKAAIEKSGLVYSSENQRVPVLEWSASRTVESSTLDPLFYIGTSAPA